jgi:N-acetylglucosamine repressor
MRRSPLQISGLESGILKHVRASSGVSRVDLARALGLAPSTAGIYVERLIDDGFLEESAKAERETGRPPMLLRLNPEGGEFVGVDFEATTILSVAVDFSDKPLRNARSQLTPDDYADDVLKKIEHTIEQVLPADTRKLLAIGVGVPGLVNSAAGTAVHYKYIKNWHNVPLTERLTKKFGVPVYLENCVRSMALAELWFGQGLGIRDFLCIGIRSGIGVGMVLNGRLYCGAHHAAGQFGRTRCPAVTGRAAAWFAGPEKATGLGPELHDVASFRAIQLALQKAFAAGERSVLRGRPQPIPLSEILHAVQQRDALTIAVIGEAAKALGWAIAQLSLVVDPEKIVLAGPLTALGETILGPMREMAGAVLAPTELRVPQIAHSTLGEFSGALGAAALAVHEWKPAR